MYRDNLISKKSNRCWCPALCPVSCLLLHSVNAVAGKHAALLQVSEARSSQPKNQEQGLSWAICSDSSRNSFAMIRNAQMECFQMLLLSTAPDSKPRKQTSRGQMTYLNASSPRLCTLRMASGRRRCWRGSRSAPSWCAAPCGGERRRRTPPPSSTRAGWP